MDNGTVKKSDVELYMALRRETEKACLFFDGIHEIWLPKSKIVEMDRMGANDYRIVIPNWLARKKEII